MARSLIILFSLVLLSAYFVVTVRHENRLAYANVHALETQRSQLQTERGRLMLERATLSIQHQIAVDAKEQLNMIPPSPMSIVTLRQSGG